MQGKIRIEHLPKLDKILRVTFTAIKKDLEETKEEFSALQDEVHSFTDSLSTKLTKTSTLMSKEVDKKTNDIDKRFSSKALDIELQITKLGTSLNSFIKKSNAKTREVNNKFKILDEFYKISEDLHKEIKNLKFLKGEVEKIAVLSKNVDVIENAAVMKVDLSKKLNKVNKRIDKKLTENDADKDFFIRKIEEDFSNEKKAVAKRNKILENKIERYNKENKNQINVVKNWHTTSKEKLDSNAKDLKKYIITETENLSNNVVKNSEELRNYIMTETSSLNKNISNNNKELKNLITEETVKNRSDVEEIKSENAKISKTFSNLVREKELNKALKKYTDLKKLNELQDEFNKEKMIRAELENEIISIRKAVSKLSEKENKIKIISEKKNKPIKIKEEKKVIKKEKPKEDKIGFFQKVLNFLIEEVEDDNDKDKRLQEFDRKKGEKFEIKEIKELK